MEKNSNQKKNSEFADAGKQMDLLIESGAVTGKRLLLHSCCAPCSSYVLTYLRSTFQITVLYYNPNITNREEYQKRAAEEKRFIDALNAEIENAGEENAGTEKDGKESAGKERAGDGLEPERTQSPYRIEYVDGDYFPEEFLEAVKGYEDCPERGKRCEICFRMRLFETAKVAMEGNFDYFATTLTLSPLKDAELLNTIGKEAGEKYGVNYLPSDFKKKGGYLKSIELSKEYGLYRQDYCGCAFSKAERERTKAAKTE